jgi:TrmH family RNA methyltransferase
MAQVITSVKNPRVQQAARLRDRRAREQQQRIIIDGVREIRRALAAGVNVVELFACPPLCTSDDARAVHRAAETAGADVLEVAEPVFGKLAFGERAEGLVAVARTPSHVLAELHLPADAFIAVADGIEKPGNLGAIVRTADAAGVSAVIAVGHGTDLYNPAAIRASLGCVFTLPVCAAATDETLAWLRGRGARIFAARVEGAIDYTAADFSGPAAVVLGSEAEGLSGVWRGDDITAVRLPMLGAADSLNVSAAAAVLFYEALRQRSTHRITRSAPKTPRRG